MNIIFGIFGFWIAQTLLFYLYFGPLFLFIFLHKTAQCTVVESACYIVTPAASIDGDDIAVVGNVTGCGDDIQRAVALDAGTRMIV